MTTPAHPSDAPATPSPARSRRPLWLAAAGLTLGAALTLGLVLTGSTDAEAEPPTSTAPVVKGESVQLAPDGPQWQYIELAVATEAPALVPLPAPGRVELDERRSASVGTPLNGRVDEMRVRIGDRVKTGDKLFSVRSAAFADLDRELKSAETEVADKQRVADRVRSLVQLQAAPEKDQQAAEAELRQARLALQGAQAKRSSLSVSTQGDNLFWVTAPRAGTVVDLDVVASQEVTSERDKPLVRISDLGEVLVVADVQESDASALREGQEVSVSTQGGAVVRKGKIERVSEVVDPQRRTVSVRARLLNDDRALRPNAFVEMTPLTSSGNTRVRVPASAVVTNGERSVVFVAREAGRLERVPVTVGRRRDGEVDLVAGLEAGSRYVSRGALLLENTIELAD